MKWQHKRSPPMLSLRAPRVTLGSLDARRAHPGLCKCRHDVAGQLGWTKFWYGQDYAVDDSGGWRAEHEFGFTSDLVVGFENQELSDASKSRKNPFSIENQHPRLDDRGLSGIEDKTVIPSSSCSCSCSCSCSAKRCSCSKGL